jgi:hypothetical protein
MARTSQSQVTFSRGVASRKIHYRNDLAMIRSALADGKNHIVDSRGILEKRPGTMFVGETKNSGYAVAIPFAYSRTQAYMLEFGHQYMRAFANYGQVLNGGVPEEVVTPWTVDEVNELSFAQSNDIMFLAHENHKYARLARVGVSDFELANFDTFDGPYLDMNTNPDWKMAIVATTLTASGPGHAPFTPAMVGRWVRVRSPNTDSPDPNVLGDEFLWDFMQITAYTSPTVVTTNHVGGNITATADFRLGAFYAGQWPSCLALHQGRLWMGKGNRLYGSRPYDFNNFAPTYHDPQGGASGRVNPDNAITLVLDSGISQSGAITKILWIRSQNYQLVIGTPVGIFAVQSNSLGDALEPDNCVVRPQDGRGANETIPISVAESVLFAHATGRRLQGTYYKNGAYDRLGSQDLSLPSDTLITGVIQRLAWQDFPHGVVWACMDDGGLLSLTLQPEEEIQGWFPQELGGRFINLGRVEPPHVESLAVIPSPDGRLDDLWLFVKRTIDGQTRRYIEVLRPFRAPGSDVRNSWFLDCGLRYDGNSDEAKTLTLTPTTPNEPWELETNFTSPDFDVGAKLSFFDGRRWHRGTIVVVDGPTSYQWQPATPNAPAAPVDGLRWFFDGEEWVQPAEGNKDFFNPVNPTYEMPAQTVDIWNWSLAVDEVSGADHLAGEPVRALIDGIASDVFEVPDDGIVELGGEGSIITLGFPFESTGELLDLKDISRAGASENIQKPAYEVSINVLDTYGLELGTGQIDTAKRVWEHYEPAVFDQPFAEGEPPLLFTGYKNFTRTQQGSQTEPKIAWRHKEPLPCTIRVVVVRASGSEAR